MPKPILDHTSSPSSSSSCSGLRNADDFIWVDRTGRKTDPPISWQKSSTFPDDLVRTFDIRLCPGDNLGLTIRGGLEYGLSIFVTHVDRNSIAESHGIRSGDEIMAINGRPTSSLTHDQVVRVLRYCPRLLLDVRDVGKVPHSPAAGSVAANSEQTSSSVSTKTSSCSSASSSAMAVAAAAAAAAAANARISPSRMEAQLNGGCVRDGNEDNEVNEVGDEEDEGEEEEEEDTRETVFAAHVSRSWHPSPSRCLDDDSPELSMVIEKAAVILDTTDFDTLKTLINDYRARAIGINEFVDQLSTFIFQEGKSSFFTEIREIIRFDDLSQFDNLVYHELPRRSVTSSTSSDYRSEALLSRWDNNSRDSSTRELSQYALTSRQRQQQQQQQQQQPVLPVSPVSETGCWYPGDEDDSCFIDEHVEYVMTPRDVGVDQGASIAMSAGGADRRFSYNTTMSAYDKSRLLAMPAEAGNRRMSTMVEEEIVDDLERRRDQQIFFSEAPYLVIVQKNRPSLGIAIEGGANTQQALPRIIAVQPNGAAYANGRIRVGQLIKEVNGIKMAGLSHEEAAKLIAECYARKDRPELHLLVCDHKPKSSDRRRL